MTTTKNFQAIVADVRPFAIANTIANLEALKAEGYRLVGVEVTHSDIAGLCEVNIDPQHTGGDATTSAVKALHANLEHFLSNDLLWSEKVACVTVRSDADSVAAMCIVHKAISDIAEEPKVGTADQIIHNALRNTDMYLKTIEPQVNAIDAHDTFAQGRQQAWAPATAEEMLAREANLSNGLNYAMLDFNLPIAQKLEIMDEFLRTGEQPAEFAAKAEADRQLLAAEFDKTFVLDGIALVVSPVFGALKMAYGKAPVVIAYNPVMPTKGGTYKKFTIAQIAPGHCDFEAVKAALQAIEPEVGGSPTILGSIQHQDTALTHQQVFDAVKAAMQA